ncbi:hypothetical protein, partial [Sphingomonas sp. BK481]|uniref:hypothetical protein n=1 Tax=Sphingomonas sp. BK481 TaxID=2586981 RepID=UPI001C85EEB7
VVVHGGVIDPAMPGDQGGYAAEATPRGGTRSRVIDCFDQWGSACAAVMTPATPQKGDGVETMSQPSAAVSAGCNTMLAAVEEALGVRRRRLYHNAMEAWAR